MGEKEKARKGEFSGSFADGNMAIEQCTSEGRESVLFKTPQHEQTYTENQEKEIETATLRKLQGSRAISEYVRPPTSSENTGLTPGEGNLCLSKR